MTKPKKSIKFKRPLRAYISPFKKWWLRRGWFGKILTALALTAFTIIFAAVAIAWYYRSTQSDKLVRYGVSFSVKYADELGVDWRNNFTALLDDLGFRSFRLMSYWDEIEPNRDQYDFSKLDWQMDRVAERGGKVMLAVGLRQPRYPECHTPEWAKNIDKSERHEELFDYLSAVVQRYSDHPALESYALENEYFNKNFGACDDFSRERLDQEIELVREIDSRHPLMLSFADQLGFPLFGPHPDFYGTSLYRGNYVKIIGYFGYPISSHFYGAKSQLIRWLHHRETVIHELQLEPWGPVRTVDLSLELQDKYMGMDRITGNMTFARRTGMKDIYLWGGEWWYWRKETFKDPTIWQTVRDQLDDLGPVSPIVN